jgi:hypothetical protein
LTAENFIGFLRKAVILNTEVNSPDIIAGNSLAALSSFNHPIS